MAHAAAAPIPPAPTRGSAGGGGGGKGLIFGLVGLGAVLLGAILILVVRSNKPQNDDLPPIARRRHQGRVMDHHVVFTQVRQDLGGFEARWRCCLAGARGEVRQGEISLPVCGRSFVGHRHLPRVWPVKVTGDCIRDHP
jgi:hypothetical protein